MADLRVSLRISATDEGAGRILAKVRKDWKEFADSVGGGMDITVRKAREARREVDAAGDAMRRAGKSARDSNPFGTLVNGARAFIGLAVTRELVRMADTIDNLNGRVRLVTTSELEHAAAMGEIFAIAQRTSTQLDATGRLYTRLSAALKDTGASQREVADLTETINKAFAVSGATGAEAAAAITQLSQGFASGTLRGDEFNSVNEQAPRIMEALAKSLGVTRGELRKMAEQGELTSQKLREALGGDQARAIAAEFEKLPLTIGRAWTRLTNSVTSAVGTLSRTTGASSGIATVLDGISKGVDWLVPKIEAMAELWATTFERGAKAAADMAGSLQNVLGLAIAGITKESRDASDAIAGDLIGSVKELATNAGRELQILPVSIGTIVTIGIGEFDKLRIRAVEAFQLIPVGVDSAWLAIRASTTGLGNGIREIIGKAIDFILEKYAAVVSTIGDMAGRVGLDGLSAQFAATAAGLRGMADAEEAARAQTEASGAAYRAEAAALDERAKAISAAAKAKRDAADDAIMAALREREAALAALDTERERAALSDRQGQNNTRAAGNEKELTAAMRAREKAARDLMNTERAALDMVAGLQGELSAVAKAQADYEIGMRALEKTMGAWLKAGGDSATVTALWRQGEELLRASLASSNAEIRKRVALTSGNDDLAEKLADQRGALAGLTVAQRNYNASVAQANAMAREAIALGIGQEEVAAGLAERLTMLAELRDNAGLEDLLGEFGEASTWDRLVEGIDDMGDALERAIGEDRLDDVARLRGALGNMRHAMVTGVVEASQAGLRSMQSMSKEGSQAYLAMEVAIQALTVVQAISAVLNQAQGDPYTAFARMAAMAAAVASLGVSVGNFASSGFSDTAARRQEEQGTGTVLGDTRAKSESILNAVEITANATTQLVGLNRGMLSALQSLQNALGAAGNLLARGAADVEFGGLSQGFNLDILGKDPLTRSLSNAIFGGGRKIVDDGIIIAGGALNDMLESIVVGAYQTIRTDGGLFGSDKIKDRITDISDTFGRQFQLVIGSIADTVREGALALGLLPADVEAALAAFRVEELRISLKDLSAEEAQAELEAVFSQLFDGLAGAVVPFIEQFQQVGEGLGETLVRIATEVQVATAAFTQLGLAVAVEKLSPERLAQVADGLVQAAGGLDEFMAGLQSFLTHFATDEHLFATNTAALTSALEQAGLALPATRDGMWALMQSLDATTAQGQEQIATLLRLADVADAYYSALEDQAERLADARALLVGMGLESGVSTFAQEIADIEAQADAAAAAYAALGVAQGRAGATTYQLARVAQWSADQFAAAIRRLQQSTQDLIAQLYGGIPGSLDAINARIDALTSVSADLTSGFDDLESAGESLFASWQNGIQSVRDYLDSMLLGDLSALSPEQRLAEARRQLEAAQAAAAGGDAQALAQLPQLADAYLRMLRDFEASGTDYNTEFAWVRDLLTSVLGVQGPGGPGAAGPTVITPSAELIALYEARDALLAEQEAAFRLGLAQQLAQNLSDLATLLNVPILQMVELQGVALTQLAADLGVNLDDLTAGSVQALGNMAATLGVSLTELTGALGVSLTDLATGIGELAQTMGIDLSNLTVESTQALAALATSLGADLSELATSVGLDLGDLADSQSLLNDALAAEIGTLPAEQAAALSGFLEAIENATTEADANAAIAALEGAVNELAPDIRTLLAPYLEGVIPADALSDLDYLSELSEIAFEQLGVLGAIRQNLAALNDEAGIPSYAVGTGNVPRTGLALIHKGEAILPASVASWLRSEGIPTGGGDPGMVAELRALRAEVAALRIQAGGDARDTRDAIRETGAAGADRTERAIDGLVDAMNKGRSLSYG